MRLFDTLTASEKQIVRYQCKQFMAHCRLFHAEVIPSIPTDDDDDGEIIPRAPATMQQQEEGWGYNEREFIGENMPTRGGLNGPGLAKEPKRDASRRNGGR